MVASPAPFYHAGESPGGGPRVLLLSWFFPPSPAVGGLRWQKFAGYLHQAGIGLDVITLHPDALAARDDARLADLPAGTRVYGVSPRPLRIERLEQALLQLRRKLRGTRPRAPATAPAGASAGAAPERADSFSRADILDGKVPGGSGWFRAYHAWLDLARVETWALAAARLGGELLQPGVHQAVISCGPPHPVHQGARRLAQRAGLPLVVDLRDPWALVERLPAHIASPTWYRLSERMEREVMAAASLIVLNTEAAESAMRARYPGRGDAILSVTNGCDEDPIAGAPDRSRFLVAYAGSIYLDRDPRPLFQAARQVVDRLQLTPARFGIEFMGNAQTYRGSSLAAIAAQERVGDFVRVHSARPRAEALAFLSGATVLLSLPQDSEMAIPSKIFEYFQFEAWLLALAEPGSATARLLEGTAADAVSSRDVAGIAAVLERRYREWQAGQRPPVLAREERFTRRHQAGRMIAALRRLLPEPATPEAPCPR